MRAPPPVEHVGAAGRAWKAALWLLLVAAVAAPFGWGLSWLGARSGTAPAGTLDMALADGGVQSVLSLAIAAVLVAGPWRRLRPVLDAQRTLCWDGEDWLLAIGDRHPRQRGDAILMLDLGPWMLVRFLPTAAAGGGTWLPLAAGPDRARWAALRGALWNWRAGHGDARP